MIAELQIPTDDGENSKFLSLKVWEIDFITNSKKYDNLIQVRTHDGEYYHPIQVNFREEST
jgi:hypothetical protein